LRGSSRRRFSGRGLSSRTSLGGGAGLSGTKNDNKRDKKLGSGAFVLRFFAPLPLLG
jgi:hypothetical protein